MTALPSNLAFVGEDLARATFRDAVRTTRRRRALTLVIVVGLLVLTATAAVANGWLFDETPTLRAVPSLGGGQVQNAFAPRAAISAVENVAQSQSEHRAATPGSSNSPLLGVAGTRGSRTLLADLGREHRTLTSVETTSGGICLVLTGFSIQCVPTFKPDQEVSWYVGTPSSGPLLVFGLVRDDVRAVEADFANGTSSLAQLANNAFYLEVTSDEPGRLVVFLSDGTSEVVADLPCPLIDPNCTS